ncbi:MAG: hypothetical protein E6K78_04865 [Candidatus Eisenbacteria bacterium]|uniref:Uncharacterized protein n=1 Tax=Eiseniibacteriota bacterium TaxID=2212470 RepID=A0A538TUZ8_UNCEI|nr:MAG: hypothetical protein E6K78_04865 [Candidatus Eisenbacteria bacterium]
MRARPIEQALVVLVLATIVVLPLGGCATTRPRLAGMPIEKRPTPPAPPDSALEEPPPGPAPKSAKQEPPNSPKEETPAKGDTAAPRPSVESVMSPQERRAALGQIVADTTSASAAVKPCASRKLLPDQESVYDTTLSLLAQTRAALAHDEVWRAQSLARKARQLAASLNCP